MNAIERRITALEAQQSPDDEKSYVSFPGHVWDNMTEDEQAAASAGVKVYLDISPDDWDTDAGHSVLTPMPPEGPPPGARTITQAEIDARTLAGTHIIVQDKVNANESLTRKPYFKPGTN